MTSREDWFLPPRNFMGLSEDYANYERARVLVLPVPYDSTTSYKSGAREGPQAILDASQQLEWFDHELERETVEVGIHTLAEVAPVMAGPETMVARVYGIARDLVASEKLLVTLGGEHSLSSSLVLAFLDQHPDLTVLHIDAHADMRDLYEETPYSHACVARRISELCPIVQAGIRSLSKEEWDYMQGDPNITTFFAEQHPLSTEEMERLDCRARPQGLRHYRRGQPRPQHRARRWHSRTRRPRLVRDSAPPPYREPALPHPRLRCDGVLSAAGEHRRRLLRRQARLQAHGLRHSPVARRCWARASPHRFPLNAHWPGSCKTPTSQHIAQQLPQNGAFPLSLNGYAADSSRKMRGGLLIPQ